jgi:zinc and cadmium transporter
VPLLATIIVFAALGGIASAAVALIFLWVDEQRSARILPHFVSFATGALLGAALLALLPEAIQRAGATGAYRIGVALIAGIGVFFIVEKLVLWWHLHDGPHDQHEVMRRHASGILVLVGDSVHNALDGVLIAAAFLTSMSLGLVTTLVVAAHEIPHRVGDFALLVHSGLSRPRALLLNLATGLASIAGAVVAYFALRSALGLLPVALAFSAAGFLYIALAGLIPGLHRRSDPASSVAQVILIACGIAVIAFAERWADH